MEYCLIYYSEIGLKKSNRAYFENRLIDNIRRRLGSEIGAKKEYGYTILSSDKKPDWQSLQYMPGVTNFYICHYRAQKDLDQVKNAVRHLVKDRQFNRFKIDTARHNKEFKLKSFELNALLGDVVKTEFDKTVDLSHPDLTIYVKVCTDHIYITNERYEGLGGLPVGTMGQAICLLSGGIDSPVAAFLAIKRGLKIRFIHFQPKAASVSEHRDKIEGIVKALKKFQWTTELLIVDFTKVQDELIVNVPPEYRMLIYRRMMIRIAGQFDKYLVLGDSLGQVASQTIQNLNAVYSAADGLILSPLIGFSKLEITNLARQIGTYELSIQGYPDCCAYFVPKHPELRATPESLDLIESKVDIDRLVNLGVENSRVLRI